MGRENELHREINGFSISHSDECVRIWGHYAIINGRDFTFFRHPIAKFDISKTVQGDNRWMAYNFVRNVYDLWLPEHFKRICSAIDMLPADLNFESGKSVRNILLLRRTPRRCAYRSVPVRCQPDSWSERPRHCAHGDIDFNGSSAVQHDPRRLLDHLPHLFRSRYL